MTIGGYPSANAIITPAQIANTIQQATILEVLKDKGLTLSFLDKFGLTSTTDIAIDLSTPIYIRPSVYSLSNLKYSGQWGWHLGPDFPADIWVIPVAETGSNKQDYVTAANQPLYNDFYFNSIKLLGLSTDILGFYRDIGLKRHDADILYLLQTGIITRSQVKANSPLLDKILYNPGYPDRLPATPSPDEVGPGEKPPIEVVIPPTPSMGVPEEPPEPTLLQSLKVPITAAMLAGLMVVEQQMTTRELISSPLMPALNAGNYKEAMGQVNVVSKTDGGEPVVANPQAVIDQMRADGIPSDDCSFTETGYANAARPYINPTNTPGFSDPNGKFPSVTQEGSSNRLVRAQSVTRSILTKKIAARVTDVRTANKFEWSQPKNSYNAVYPFNQVRQTESGHIQEFDDTPGSERIHTYHKSGTYEEIDPNGSRINRIVGDDFEILERNGHVLIKGSCNVTIMGDSRLRIERDAWIDIKGDLETKVMGNMKSVVDGKVEIDALGLVDVLTKENISLRSEKQINILSSKDINIGSGGNVNITGKNIYLDEGNTIVEQLRFPQNYKKRPMPRFTDLIIANKDRDVVANYEVPEEGSGKDYHDNVKSLGIDKKTQAEERMTEKDTKAPVQKAAAPVTTPTTDIESCSVFTPAFQLSPNFTLKQLTVGSCGGHTEDKVIIDNLRNLAVNCLEPIYKCYPNLKITSGYRKIIPKGGSTTSDHLDGNAADFQLEGFTRKQTRDACVVIGQLLPAFTQLILEYRGASNWIHVAYARKKGAKMQQFTMNNDKTHAQGFVLVA